MAFWALGALDKFKGISIKDATQKLKDYVVLPVLSSKSPPINSSLPHQPNNNPYSNHPSNAPKKKEWKSNSASIKN